MGLEGGPIVIMGSPTDFPPHATFVKVEPKGVQCKLFSAQ